MKIAIDLTSLADNFSGIERFAANIARCLIKEAQNYEYILVFKQEVHPFFRAEASLPNVSVCILRPCNKLLFSQVILPKALRKLKADIYLFLAFPAPFFFFKPSISTIHDLSCVDCPETMTLKSRMLWRILDWKAAKFGKAVLTISNFSKQRIMEHYSLKAKSVHVAYCGIDCSLFGNYDFMRFNVIEEKYNLPKKYIVSLSTIEPRKNLQLLVSAWNELLSNGAIDVDLVLAGRSGWKNEGLLKDVSIENRDRVHFTGFIEDEDLPLLYKGSVLFVFPSIYEGFGLPPLEALCSGAKVLCSRIPSLVEVCGERAMYFESNNVKSLEEAIVDALNGESANGAEACSLYNWESEALQVKKMIDELI